jgi:hypothetical protein
MNHAGAPTCSYQVWSFIGKLLKINSVFLANDGPCCANPYVYTKTSTLTLSYLIVSSPICQQGCVLCKPHNQQTTYTLTLSCLSVNLLICQQGCSAAHSTPLDAACQEVHACLVPMHQHNTLRRVCRHELQDAFGVSMSAEGQVRHLQGTGRHFCSTS